MEHQYRPEKAVLNHAPFPLTTELREALYVGIWSALTRTKPTKAAGVNGLANGTRAMNDIMEDGDK